MQGQSQQSKHSHLNKVRTRGTGAELILRKGLFSRGLRYRLNDATLVGTPDLVFSKRRAVIFVHGCFWHGHGCEHFRWPKTRAEFWRAKIESNNERDDRVKRTLIGQGWRVLVVWECALRRVSQAQLQQSVNRAAEWIRSEESFLELPWKIEDRLGR